MTRYCEWCCRRVFHVLVRAWGPGLVVRGMWKSGSRNGP